MELRLELGLSTGPDPFPDRDSSKKRRFGEALLGDETSLALQAQTRKSPFSNRNVEAEDGFVVGWPPMKSWRKQLCYHNRRACAANYVNVENRRGGGGGGWWRRNSIYVKVKMEGVGITRKIDLSSYSSHRSLASNLIHLFGKCEDGEYKLMYLNKEGEWLQAGDLPWECFIRSVQRLKLEKNGC